MYIIQNNNKYSELQESFDFPHFENVNQNKVSIQLYPGNIRFSVYIIERGQFLPFTCNSTNFDYISNDFKQKSPNLNNLSKSSEGRINIEPGYPRFARDINVFKVSLKTLQLVVRIFIKLTNCIFSVVSGYDFLSIQKPDMNNYRLASIHAKLKSLDEWLRNRLRYCIWHDWKNPERKRKNLIRLGIKQGQAHALSRTNMGGGAVAQSPILGTTITLARVRRTVS